MHETPDDLATLQGLLDRSYVAAGQHLRRIVVPERRLSAMRLAERLTGIRLLALATVTAGGRPLVGSVDGVFFRGAFHFGSSPGSIRLRHITARPYVSATHLCGEESAVTVHGRAVPIDIHGDAGAELRETLLEVYVPHYGAGCAEFLDSGIYARIDAERMFTSTRLTAAEGDSSNAAVQSCRIVEPTPQPL